MFGPASFKNEELTLYLTCVWARLANFKNEELTFIVFSVCLGEARKLKNEELTYIVLSVCLGSQALRTKNIHCI